MPINPQNMFGVVTRDKTRDTCTQLHNALTEEQANRVADELQAANPDREYAVVRLVFVRYTQPAIAGD